MKLAFLGQSYETILPAIAATETAETATFLGQPYTRKQYQVSQRQPPTAELTYRGIRYWA